MTRRPILGPLAGQPASEVSEIRSLIELSVRLGDNGTRELVAPILTESEEHVGWLKTQLYRIERVGIENYLSEQMGGHDG